jgi:predicted nicotinamide N-methyase
MAGSNTIEDIFSSTDELPLDALRDFVLEETYEWLEDEDQKQRAWLKIQRSLQAFQQQQAGPATSAPSSEPQQPRVCEWSSSQLNPDGYGGIDEALPIEGRIPHDVTKVSPEDVVVHPEASIKENGSITVKYILSDNWQGFGNQVWAAARHLANMLVDPERCRLLLSINSQSIETSSSRDSDQYLHPLQGLWFCELGAGAAIPSWTALRMGARVVTLDQAIAGRIRVVAECAARNWHDVQSLAKQEEQDCDTATSNRSVYRPVVFPHDWAAPVDDLLLFLGAYEPSRDRQQHDLQQNDVATNHPLFDVVVATECLFMPWFYSDLLDSIESLLSKGGVAILTSALHGNVPEEEVWGFVDLAEERGFVVDQPVPPTQLTPQKADMKLKQALVYTIRLTRRHNTDS